VTVLAGHTLSKITEHEVVPTRVLDLVLAAKMLLEHFCNSIFNPGAYEVNAANASALVADARSDDRVMRRLTLAQRDAGRRAPRSG
jgi:hypothetical protein